MISCTVRLLVPTLALLAVPAAAQQSAAPTAPSTGPSTPTATPAPATQPRPAPRTPVHRSPPAAKPAAQGQAQGTATPKPPAKPPQRPAPARPHPAVPPVALPAVPAAPPAPATPAPPEPERPAPDPAKGSNTGLPIPRFVSLRSDEVNLRTGPGTRYPIDWVYKRRDLPVEVEREFEVWRLVRDQDGTKGWVHQATLVARRTGIVTGGERTLRSSASEDGSAVARLKPGVILRLRNCAAGAAWCQASVGDYRGWIKRTEFWGTYPGEAIQ